jgi:anti-sigma factor ChrR (cupin superfamily)
MTLADYAVGVLEVEEAVAVAGHLIDCHTCRQESRELAAFLAEPDPVENPRPLERCVG